MKEIDYIDPKTLPEDILDDEKRAVESPQKLFVSVSSCGYLNNLYYELILKHVA